MKNKTYIPVIALHLFFTLCISTLLLPLPAQATDNAQQQDLVDKARMTFSSFMRDENMSWIQNNFSEAKGLIIVPSQIKGGFFLGGSGGNGLLIVKDPETGQWSHPGFYTIGAVSFGLQIGGEAAELIMVVRTDRGLTNLYSSSLKLGGDVSVTAGPVGAGAKSDITADIVTFSRSKGAYAGVSAEGSVLKIRHEWNEAYYGQPVTPMDIFVKQNVHNPGAEELVQTVSAAE